MRILLIEDDPQLSEALASFLRAKGFVVDTAGTLAQARATLPPCQSCCRLLKTIETRG